MKRIKALFAFLMIFTMALSLTACGNTNSNDTSAHSDVLVAYFSATGTTKGVAEKIAAVTGGDLYEILAAEPYTSDDLNYNDSSSRATKEQNDKSVRPEIGSEDISLEGYSTIYLGFPIWWGEEPRILDTFVEKYSFEGITMIPFCTSGGSGIGRSGPNMEALAGSGTWLDGQRFSGTVTEADLQAWIAASSAENMTMQANESTSETAASEAADPAVEENSPVVYFTSDISAEGLVKIYDTLGWTPEGKAAVKISTGEPPASNYLRPELIGDLVKKVDGTIVECNTAYGGSRSSSAMHKQVAEDHGFTAIADFDLMDEEGEVEWLVTGGTRLDKVIVGSHAENYTDWVILSHFKGHAMAGFGGAIKNVGIGISSPSGKVYVHTAGTKTSGSIWYNDQDAWLEALAEMVSGFSSHVGKNHIIYINVMNRLSVDCDCDGNPAEPDIHDIGILAGTDPVALDQACVDLIYQAEGNESLVDRMESLHGIHTLEHAEEIGLGSRTYTLVNIDG